MPTTPPAVAALPAPPDPNDRSTFNARAYPWSVAQQTLATNLASLGANVFGNATEAFDSAATATAQANAAIAAAGAVLWVSGTNYAAGAAVYSPINLASYRTGTAGISSTDPSIDTARWTRLGASGVPDFILQAQGVI
jgi:hypothetical protein